MLGQKTADQCLPAQAERVSLCPLVEQPFACIQAPLPVDDDQRSVLLQVGEHGRHRPQSDVCRGGDRPIRRGGQRRIAEQGKENLQPGRGEALACPQGDLLLVQFAPGHVNEKSATLKVGIARRVGKWLLPGAELVRQW